MHGLALEPPRVGWSSQLRLARRAASARVDVLRFSAVAAIVSLHFLTYAGRGAGGEELQPHYYEALGQPKTMWMIPEAGHTGGLSARPNEYERRVVGFFDRTLFPGAEDTS